VPRLQPLGPPEIQVADSAVLSATVLGEDGRPLRGSIPAARNDRWRAIGIQFRCTSPTLGRTNVTITMRPAAFGPVAIQLDKLCGGPRPGATVATDASTLMDFDLEAAQTKRVRVVRDGAAIPNWANTRREGAAEVERGVEGSYFSVLFGRMPDEEAWRTGHAWLPPAQPRDPTTGLPTGLHPQNYSQRVLSVSVVPMRPREDWLTIVTNGTLVDLRLPADVELGVRASRPSHHHRHHHHHHQQPWRRGDD
jgi:hypothetical protein